MKKLWYRIKWAWKLRSLWRGWFSRRVDKWKFEREQKKGNCVRITITYDNDIQNRHIIYQSSAPDKMPMIGAVTKYGIITEWSVDWHHD